MEYNRDHLARLYEAKYSLSYAEGHCLSRELFEAALNIGNEEKILNIAAELGGCLMMLGAQGRIKLDVADEIYKGLKEVVLHPTPEQGMDALQGYIAELFVTVTFDAARQVIAELKESE